jgi:Ala-tRNA(Pro) deacylase
LREVIVNIAPSVQDYLATQQIAYEVIAHPRTVNSSGTAQAAHLPGTRVAKAVVFKDKAGYVVAVLSSTHHVSMSQLGRALHRHPLELASESELKSLFADCDVGAVPPLGAAYGLPMIVEEALGGQPEVFFEAGDHEHVIHVTQSEFLRLTSDAPRARFSRPDGTTGGATWMQ